MSEKTAIPSEVVLEDAPCPHGCREGDEKLFTGRDMLHGLAGEFCIVKCRQCGLVRTDPRPTPETIGYYYPADYGPYQDKTTKADDRRWTLSRRLKAWVRGVFQFNYKRIPRLPPRRALEIGCASGEYLAVLRSQGWEVCGIEFSEEAAESARANGFDVSSGPLERVPSPAGKFDLFVAWMVLEHLHDPIASLRRLRGWANPGACLAISVPNISSWDFRLFGSNLYSLHLPNHLYHFDLDSLKRVLRAGGWEIDEVFHHRTLANYVASTGYVLREVKGLQWLARWLVSFPQNKYLPFILFPISYVMAALGQTGRVTVWARCLDE